MAIKGELFSGDMVKAFLENRKGRTSRPIKNIRAKCFHDVDTNEPCQMYAIGNGSWCCKEELISYAKYQPGDIMYCRETWRIHDLNEPAFCMMVDYKADNHAELQIEFKPSRFDKFKKFFKKFGWILSIFMPREAARLWFRVTDVKVQNIVDMTEEDAEQDGFINTMQKDVFGTEIHTALQAFQTFWNAQYGTESPWMYVYYLEKISKEEALKA